MQDLLLPRSLTSRLARGVLPANTSIQKDAILALTKSATVFISYLASHANEQTAKKTIGPQDVLNALKEIEMGGVMGLGAVGEDGRVGGRLERELELFELAVSAKRKGYREKVKLRESGGVANAVDVDGEGEDRGEPLSKRMRRMSVDDALLDAQLNGPTSDEAEEAKATADEDQLRRPVPSDPAHQRQRESGLVDDNDDTEDDPDVEEDDEEDDDEDADEEEDEEQDQAETQDEDRVAMDENDDDRDGGAGHRAARMGLAPNGRVEIGSEDESD